MIYGFTGKQANTPIDYCIALEQKRHRLGWRFIMLLHSGYLAVDHG